VGRRDDGSASTGLAFEDVHQVLLRARVDAGHGLVEEVEVGLRGERAGEEDTAPLAARQPPDLRIDVAGHPDLRERVPNGPVVVGPGAGKQSEAGVPAHHGHVAHSDGEIPVDQLGLRDVRDTTRLLTGRVPEHLDPSAPRLEEPGDDLEQRALSGAVRAHDGEERAGLDREVDLLERRAVAIAGRDIGEPDVGVRPSMPGVEARLHGRQAPVTRRHGAVGRPGGHRSAASMRSTFASIIPM
jgi:hypothetical protein